MTESLPEGWVYTTLKTLVGPEGLFTDGDWILSEHLKTGNDVRLIQLADIGIGVFQDKSKKHISSKTAHDLRVTFLRQNDVLISRMADPLARACLFPTLGLPAITAVDVAIARCDESVCIPAYLMNLCNSFQVLVQAEAAAVGTTRKRISRKNLEEIQVGLPPLPEQKRIVNILEMLADKVDHCNARLRTITALLKRFRQSVLASACSGRLTADWRIQRNGAPAPDETNAESDDLPLGWKAVCVSDVIDDLKYGTSQKCGYEKRGVPVLRIPNVAKGVIDHNDIKYAELPAKEQKQLHLLPGDILIVRSNGSVSFVGKCALVGEHERGFSYAGYLIRIRPNQTIVSPEFLNLALSSYDVRLQIELQARSTSGVNNINSEEVRALRLSLPPLDEQEEIVRRVNKLFILADKIETRYKAVQQQVDHLPQSILAKAFRGELVPTEAELAEREGRSYESAEQLLQRIKYSRGTAPASIVKKRGKQPTSK